VKTGAVQAVHEAFEGAWVMRDEEYWKRMRNIERK
jgi:hypothetical protein